MKTIHSLIPILLLISIIYAYISYAGSGLETDSPSDPGTDIKILQSWQGDFPVSQLHLLPKGQQHFPIGYIDDFKTFSAVWQAFTTSEETPDIDFTDNLVIFARNTQFYNGISIKKIILKNGIAQILAMETMSAMPIEDKVAMSIAVISGEGVKGVRSGKEIIPIH